jgi:hypothetical protein
LRAVFGVRGRRMQGEGRGAYLVVEFAREWELDHESCGYVVVLIVFSSALVGGHIVAR